MGQWVILIGNAGFGLDAVKSMTFEGKTDVRQYGDYQLDVLFQEGYVSFQFDYYGTDYPPEELKALPYDEPQFVILQYSDKALMERVIAAKDFPKDVLIDCDGVDLGLERIFDKSRLRNYEE